jgi:hypothetical protein
VNNLDRIVRVLTTHGYAVNGTCWGVDCDWRGDPSDHPLHVAEQVQALFTEEMRYQFTHTATGRSTILELVDTEQAKAIERRDKLHSLTFVRRWVSDYEEVES